MVVHTSSVPATLRRTVEMVSTAPRNDVAILSGVIPACFQPESKILCRIPAFAGMTKQDGHRHMWSGAQRKPAGVSRRLTPWRPFRERPRRPGMPPGSAAASAISINIGGPACSIPLTQAPGVIPAKAGIPFSCGFPNPGLRRGDVESTTLTGVLSLQSGSTFPPAGS